jgi:cytoplasmic iron level regulating protein YaaA (DUF328/UPF0246 family)
MIIILSPAKSLDFETPIATPRHTEPELLDDAQTLVDQMKDYDVDGLMSLMKISEDLAELNVDRFQNFEFPFEPSNARQALMTFDGHVYRDIEWQDYTEEEFDFAQDHVRILSGLYGVLRPLDLMQAYRLEMGTRLSNDRGSNLYDFWGTRVSERLNEALKAQGDDVILNLASNEYFKAVDTDALEGRVVTPVFQQWRPKKDAYAIVSVYAKLARGTMTNWVVRNGITDVEDVKKFDLDGYYYSEDASTDAELVFLRDEKP